MNTKYRILKNDKICVNDSILYRIKALRDFGGVETGDLGGYIEKEENLSQYGDCWVYDYAWVYDDAHVFGDAQVFGEAHVYGNARVYDDAQVYGDVKISGNAHVFGDAQVYGDAHVYEDANVFGEAWVYDDAHVYGTARVHRHARVHDSARVFGYARVCDYGDVGGNAMVSGDVQIINDTAVYDSMVVDNINQIFFAGYLGSRNDTTYFIYTNGNIHVQCGCFEGTIDEFEKKVKSTYNTDNIFLCNYLDTIDYVKRIFEKRFPVVCC
jgi:carbonic anhydrase/acetyltransferase-like protein (isoleucine patch superfamily)